MKIIPAGLSMQYRTRKRGALSPLPHAWCLIPYGHNVTVIVGGYGNVWRYWRMQEIGTVPK